MYRKNPKKKQIFNSQTLQKKESIKNIISNIQYNVIVFKNALLHQKHNLSIIFKLQKKFSLKLNQLSQYLQSQKKRILVSIPIEKLFIQKQLNYCQKYVMDYQFDKKISEMELVIITLKIQSYEQYIKQFEQIKLPNKEVSKQKQDFNGFLYFPNNFNNLFYPKINTLTYEIFADLIKINDHSSQMWQLMKIHDNLVTRSIQIINELKEQNNDIYRQRSNFDFMNPENSDLTVTLKIIQLEEYISLKQRILKAHQNQCYIIRAKIIELKQIEQFYVMNFHKNIKRIIQEIKLIMNQQKINLQ